MPTRKVGFLFLSHKEGERNEKKNFRDNLPIDGNDASVRLRIEADIR